MVISVPATSANLGPGFDTLGLALELKNRFCIKPASISSIQIRGEGAKNPKLRIDNIFMRIFNETLLRLTGEKSSTFRFQFHNLIPISRGLGSSSAVIIGAIEAAFLIAQKEPNPQEILALAQDYESHPDNITPACVGGFTVSVNNKGAISYLKKELPSAIKAVVVIPNRSISTAYSRQSLPKRYARHDCVFNLSHSSLLVAAFFSEQWEILREASRDRFHQEVRMRHFPVLFEVQRIALKKGALMSTLSGSGSSFFNLCFREDSRALALGLEERFPQFRVLELEFDNKGVEYDD
ncbi:MAG: homoserine kinase [Wolinella sp.]